MAAGGSTDSRNSWLPKQEGGHKRSEGRYSRCTSENAGQRKKCDTEIGKSMFESREK